MADAYWGAYWGAHNGAWMAANPEVELFIWAVAIIGGVLYILGIMLLELGRLLADWAEAYPKAAAAVVAADVRLS